MIIDDHWLNHVTQLWFGYLSIIAYTVYMQWISITSIQLTISLLAYNISLIKNKYLNNAQL
jgi:hypothetical protein